MSVPARAPWAAALAVPLLVLGASCTCEGPPPGPATACTGVTFGQPGRTATCAADAECGDHHACREVASPAATRCCVFADRACRTEADCCPGQTCPSNRLRCLDKADACTSDADCGALGDRVCQSYTDHYGTSRRCRYLPCGPGGACPASQSCFQGECLAGLPCGGGCGPGQACVPTIGRCQDFAAPPRTGAACPLSCAPGFIGTFADGRNLWDACTLPQVACVCAELPPLAPGDLGRDSALAVVPGEGVYVSTYDATYGDLVVLRFGLDGGLEGLTAVDGVPDAGPRQGPSGPRGGVAEPGPDVGRGTDLAAAGGRLYVSYQDVDHGDLKVAVRDPQGAWSSHTVDGARADVGRFTSLAVDSAGRPGVAYFQRSALDAAAVEDCPLPRPPGPPGRVTALRFARASGPAPAGPGDWTVRTLSCLATPAPVCEGCGGVCADTGAGGPRCLEAATGCAACTGATRVCVGPGTAPTCATRVTPPTPLAEVPAGVGLFPSLAFRGDQALIAALRLTPPAVLGGAAKGELIGVQVSAALVPGPVVVLDASGDTGWFPDLRVDAATGQVGIGYHDLTARALRFYLAPELQAGVRPELVDDGLHGDAGQATVGADSAVVFLPGGDVVALYQDATHGDLELARRSASGWTVRPPVVTSGAVGFFTDAVVSGGRLYVSHARLGARSVQGTVRSDAAVLLEVLVP